MNLRYLALCLLAPLFIFCKSSNKSNQDNDSDENIYTEGWHFRKNKNDENEKFFAFGAWHVPGYTPTEDIHPDRSSDEEIFKTQARNLNIILTHHRSFERFMMDDDRIIMTVNPSEFLRSYLNNVPSLSNKGVESGYYKSQYLKKIVNDKEFLDSLDADIKKSMIERFPNAELAFLPIDEVALGLFNSHWFTPPVVGEKIYEKIKSYNPNAIVFVDLTGHGKGSSFFFEKRYLKDHPSMPTDPPYEAVKSESARNHAKEAIKSGKVQALLVFNEGYNGVPGYKFENNRGSYNSFTLEELKSTHYENIKQYAEAYEGNGNVFGINAFRDFHAHPILAGITVDAIRDGLKNSKTPIWLYFDGNGYAKPKEMEVDAYVKELKCQMYTSIIHGATGVFFWNDRSKTPEVWNALQPVLEEMKENLDLVKLKTQDRKVNGDLHILIKEDNKGNKFLLASNTSKTDSIPLNLDYVEKKSLSPLEVLISPIK